MSDPLPSGRFAGREAFEQLVRDALERAAQEGWREIVLCDASFLDWPLRERVVVQSLHAWATAGRRMIMLAARYDEVLRHHARFVEWRKTWSHIVECRVCRDVVPDDFPSALWSKGWFMQRVELEHSAGVCGNDPQRLVQLREALEEKKRHSSPGFAPSILGL